MHKPAPSKAIVGASALVTVKVLNINIISKKNHKAHDNILIKLAGKIPHIVKNIPNVLGFLGTKGEADPIRPSEVNRILGKVDELAINTDSVAIPFVHGETIKVIDGPFNGFNGTVEKINEEKRKLEVMVKIFGRKTPLELSYMQVEKI